MANNQCKECGCICNKCVSHDVHLHVEIENLKQRLVERDNHIVTMETTFLNEADRFPNGEFVALREELLTWQDKYSRLYEAHKRVQKVNQSLEEKLLKLVDKTETEKSTLTKDVATLSHRLADANYTIQRLQGDNEKYKNDVNLAIQLLQCKPANFVSHRLDSFPNEMQAKVSSYVASRRKPPEDKKPAPEIKSIKVPIPTFPPTAMVYTVPKTPSPEKDTSQSTDNDRPQVDKISAAIMAKILEEREKERSVTKHCDSCTCSKTNFPTLLHSNTHAQTVATQTGNQKASPCLRCDTEKSPLSGMKIISELPKISSKYFDAEKNKVAVSENSKVVVNAISESFVKNTKNQIDPKSGHHRLCEQSELEIEKKVKGPRYCSMRLQSGSKNILLDNVHGTYAPVLYTRQESNERKPKLNCDKTISVHHSTKSGSTGSEERKSLQLSECDNNYHKQQRVAEWVQNIDENDASNSEHSLQSKPLSDFDKSETEAANVRNFLHENKESVRKLLYKTDVIENDFKTVKKHTNLNKMYQSLAQNDSSIIELKSSFNNKNNSHTETEI